MQRSVVGREREKREGESRETQFTHMVLVSGLPLRTMWSGTNFTFHSLRHFCLQLKGHFQSFHIWTIHTVQLNFTHENNNGKLERCHTEVDSGLNSDVIYMQRNKAFKSTMSLLSKCFIDLWWACNLTFETFSKRHASFLVK